MPEQTKTDYVKLDHTFEDVFAGGDVTASFRFKRPDRKDYERMQSRAMKKPAAALKDLCVAALHPEDKNRFKEKLAQYPGLATTFGGILLKSCGAGDALGN